MGDLAPGIVAARIQCESVKGFLGAIDLSEINMISALDCSSWRKEGVVYSSRSKKEEI